MSDPVKAPRLFSKIYSLVRTALKGEEGDYTTGSLNKAIILLAIPMMLEMVLESVFAIVDLYFVGHLPNSSQAVQIVGLTESVLTIMYSVAIGMSMAATAVVARRTGEKDPRGASQAAVQAIIVSTLITLPFAIGGVIFAKDILLFMGASEATATVGTPFVRLMMGSSLVVMLLFLINGVFRGAGNAAIAMKSLSIANILNIILCPVLIHGAGPVEGMGLIGAALSTVIGRSVGVAYQLYHLFNGRHIVRILLEDIKLRWEIIRNMLVIATPAIFQFIIASCSWIFLAQLVARNGGDVASAGYQTALRLMMFFILPAWGLSNAAATLVGQNLGAKQPDRAEASVKITVKYNVLFMAAVTIFFFAAGEYLVKIFTTDPATAAMTLKAIRIIACGYVFYGVGMVMVNAFNGAGDTMTPTKINFVGFWLFQIPLAYVLAGFFGLGATGVFIAVPIAEGAISLAGFYVFRKGKWKTVKV